MMACYRVPIFGNVMNKVGWDRKREMERKQSEIRQLMIIDGLNSEHDSKGFFAVFQPLFPEVAESGYDLE